MKTKTMSSLIITNLIIVSLLLSPFSVAGKEKTDAVTDTMEKSVDSKKKEVLLGLLCIETRHFKVL